VRGEWSCGAAGAGGRGIDSSVADEDGPDRDSMDGTRCRRDEVDV
jgi:hypothetical protein